jgi:hypothetical protein
MLSARAKGDGTMEQKGSRSAADGNPDEGPELDKPKKARPKPPDQPKLDPKKKAARPKDAPMAKLKALEPKRPEPKAVEPRKAHERKETEFMKLTPTKDASIGSRSKALDFVFANSDIKNIGIIGPPGSGKTSVIETYEANSRVKFIHLGLARFDGSQYVDEGTIERKLVCQLSRIMRPSGPKTQREVSFAQGAIICVSAIAIILFGLHLAFFQAWVDFANSVESNAFRDILSITVTNDSRLLSAAILIISIIALIAFAIIQLQENASTKAHAAMMKIDPVGYMPESFFDRRFCEVADEFEKSKALNFVFEDLDSFNYIRIFERIREINLLINCRERKTPVRFFYTMRDGFFSESDKNKFFDFVIPVPPSHGSSLVFSELAKSYDIDTELIKAVTATIKDCRQAKSAVNEFEMMTEDREDLDTNKALAMVAYKSVFPEDYRDLVSGRGLLRAIFGGGIKAINELEQNNRLFLKNEIEVYEKMHSLLGEFSGRTEEEYINALRENNDVYQAYRGLVEEMIYNGNRETLDLPSTIMYLSSKINYMKNSARSPKRIDIREILQYESLESLLAEESYESVKGSKCLRLLEFLLKNGFIDETFYGYVVI